MRKFQHPAQIELSTDRENLYEYLRYSRHSPIYLSSIQEVGKRAITEGVVVQIKELMNELTKIQTN